MTPYIKQQLIKLCDHPEWFDDMLTIWDNNPENLIRLFAIIYPMYN